MVEGWPKPNFYGDEEHLANSYRYDIEVSLLIGLILDNYLWAEMPEMEQLEPSDFVRPVHGAIFSVIKTLKEANEKPNFFTVGLYFYNAFPDYYKAIDGDRWFNERAHEYYWYAISRDNLSQYAKDIMRGMDNCRAEMGLPIKKRSRKRSIEL